jgi:sugar phosphate isomerase/epimerase
VTIETPRFSVSEATTNTLTFAEDLEALAKAGAEGIGIHGEKLRDDREDLARFRASGLKATICAPETFSILPYPLWPGEADPAKRVELVCNDIRTLAPYAPNACTVNTGPQWRFGADEARQLVVDGYRTIARAAAEVGVTVALEPFHRSFREDWTLVGTLPEMVSLLEEIDEPNTAMLYDVWHLWDTPDVLELTRTYAHRFAGVHVDDWRDPTRGWCDRVLPGDGIADLEGIFGALDDGGYAGGWLDLEIISDDGTFGVEYEDSLWNWDPVELIRAGRERTLAAWANRRTATP